MYLYLPSPYMPIQRPQVFNTETMPGTKLESIQCWFELMITCLGIPDDASPLCQLGTPRLCHFDPKFKAALCTRPYYFKASLVLLQFKSAEQACIKFPRGFKKLLKNTFGAQEATSDHALISLAFLESMPCRKSKRLESAMRIRPEVLVGSHGTQFDPAPRGSGLSKARKVPLRWILSKPLPLRIRLKLPTRFSSTSTWNCSASGPRRELTSEAKGRLESLRHTVMFVFVPGLRIEQALRRETRGVGEADWAGHAIGVSLVRLRSMAENSYYMQLGEFTICAHDRIHSTQYTLEEAAVGACTYTERVCGACVLVNEEGEKKRRPVGDKKKDLDVQITSDGQERSCAPRIPLQVEPTCSIHTVDPRSAIRGVSFPSVYSHQGAAHGAESDTAMGSGVGSGTQVENGGRRMGLTTHHVPLRPARGVATLLGIVSRWPVVRALRLRLRLGDARMAAEARVATQGEWNGTTPCAAVVPIQRAANEVMHQDLSTASWICLDYSRAHFEFSERDTKLVERHQKYSFLWPTKAGGSAQGRPYVACEEGIGQNMGRLGGGRKRYGQWTWGKRAKTAIDGLSILDAASAASGANASEKAQGNAGGLVSLHAELPRGARLESMDDERWMKAHVTKSERAGIEGQGKKSIGKLFLNIDGELCRVIQPEPAPLEGRRIEFNNESVTEGKLKAVVGDEFKRRGRMTDFKMRLFMSYASRLGGFGSKSRGVGKKNGEPPGQAKAAFYGGKSSEKSCCVQLRTCQMCDNPFETARLIASEEGLCLLVALRLNAAHGQLFDHNGSSRRPRWKRSNSRETPSSPRGPVQME
ncbi:hypothetical protein DFH06DRAFT_1135989 [Mycena polygramma]|nr:hypothetical protein DFH06DRAFT_1135989 [Mycena polygramma]